jgi:uncharacterized protein YycO
MPFNKYHLLVCFGIFFAMAVSMVVASVPAIAAPTNDAAAEKEAVPVEVPSEALVGDTWGGNGNSLNFAYLQVGDIISVKGVIVGAAIGEIWMGYSHTAIYIGNSQMVEAWKQGVRIAPVSMVHNADCAQIDRVSTSSSVKNAALNFMKQQVGKPYDYIWLTYIGGKQVYGSSYYCSELAWAGYKTQGVDIDQNTGFHWRYGNSVAPQEIVDDGNTYFVAYSS